MFRISNKKEISFIMLLLAIDQGVKLIIFNKFNHLMNVCTPINRFLKIHPLFNEEINWLNVRWNLGVTRKMYIILVIVALVFFIFLLGLCKFEMYHGNNTKKNWVIFIIIAIAGLLGALCDKLFLGNSLDYIEMGPWIFDLKDVYLVIGSLGLGILAVFHDIKYKSKTIDEIKKVPDVIRFMFKNTKGD